MADLTFSALSAKLPAGAITTSGGDLLISAKTVMGETSVSINDQKLGEFFSKLLDAASNAQNDWNAISSPKFRSYNAPSASTPFRDPVTGLYSANFTYTIIVDIPLNRDSVNAVESSTVGF